jgi:peptide/nickel transport system permease protein
VPRDAALPPVRQPRRVRAALAVVARAWQGLRGTPLKFRLGLGILTLLVAIALVEPVVTDLRLGGRSATSIGTFARLQGSSLQTPLGTDIFGRDLLALQMIGLRYSLLVGFVAGALATLVGVTVALVGGYVGGRVDGLLNMVTNAVIVTPSLPILMAVAVFARLDMLLLAFVLAFFSWPWPARIIRAQVLSLRERPYVDFARVSGFGRFEIMYKELLPNLVPFVVVGFAYAVIGNILAETGLRLIGLGPGDLVTLGLMLNWAVNLGALAQGWYLMVLGPVGALILIFVALSLINVGIEERFNPRLKGVTGR